MKDLAINTGYKVVIETSDFVILNNDEIEQLIILMPRFDFGAKYIEEIIDTIEQFSYNKKTIAFIQEIKQEMKEEVTNDEYYFMKIEGYRDELIPRKINKTIKFEGVESQPKECDLFYNPYLSMTANIINLLNEINNGTDNKITYKHPKVMELSYIKYFLLKKLYL